MSYNKSILSILLVFGYLGCCAQSDEKLVESQVDRMVADWNSREFKNMDLYTTEDVQWVNIVGMWWKGRTDVKNAHQLHSINFLKVFLLRKQG